MILNAKDSLLICDGLLFVHAKEYQVGNMPGLLSKDVGVSKHHGWSPHPKQLSELIIARVLPRRQSGLEWSALPLAGSHCSAGSPLAPESS